MVALSLEVHATDSDAADLDRLAGQLRRELLELDVDDVQGLSEGEAPLDSKGIDLAVVGTSKAIEYSFEGDGLPGSGQPSVFTGALVQGMESGEADRGGDGLIDIDELYEYVYGKVRLATPNQTPGKWATDVEGEFYIARNPVSTQIIPLAPDQHQIIGGRTINSFVYLLAHMPTDLRETIESPNPAVRRVAVTRMSDMLSKGSFALPDSEREVLRQVLQRLADEDDSRSVSEAAASALTARAPSTVPSRPLANEWRLARGSHKIGPNEGKIIVRVSVDRTSVGAKMGHDLVFEAARWSGNVTVDPDNPPASSVAVNVDARSLAIVHAQGGATPLSEKDRKAISTNIDKCLQTSAYSEIIFRSTHASGTPPTISLQGELTLLGRAWPINLELTVKPGGMVSGKVTLLQSRFGIKPFSAMLGALKVADSFDIDIEVTLPAP